MVKTEIEVTTGIEVQTEAETIVTIGIEIEVLIGVETIAATVIETTSAATRMTEETEVPNGVEGTIGRTIGIGVSRHIEVIKRIDKIRMSDTSLVRKMKGKSG